MMACSIVISYMMTVIGGMLSKGLPPVTMG